jgi:hypothetical protein
MIFELYTRFHNNTDKFFHNKKDFNLIDDINNGRTLVNRFVPDVAAIIVSNSATNACHAATVWQRIHAPPSASPGAPTNACDTVGLTGLPRLAKTMVARPAVESPIIDIMFQLQIVSSKNGKNNLFSM